MWEKAEFKDWEIFFKTDEKIINPYHHGHHDFYSFVLHDNGVPIMVDSGGASYDKANKYSQTAKFSESHNTILINNLGYKPKSIKYLPSDYWNSEFSYKCIKNDTYVKIELSCTGFNRIDNSINLTRTIILSDEGVTIKDSSNSNVSHKISNYFHFDPNIELKYNDHELIIEGTKRNYVFKHMKTSNISINPTDEYRFYSEKYGINNKKSFIKNQNIISKNLSITHFLERTF